jgi:putative Mg2+ transporter-C (MgtC) family protein
MTPGIITEDWSITLYRLLFAALLGGLVGLDREFSGKPAGLRTNILICVGAALLTELSIAVARAGDPNGPIRADPGRIAAQIVTGIGFLGAGAILQSRRGVRGLTTAASIWVVAAIGMAVGAGAYFMAGAATVIVVLTLFALPQLEYWLAPFGRIERTIRIGVNEDVDLNDVATRVRSHGLNIASLNVEHQADGTLLVAVEGRGRAAQWQAAVQAFTASPGVHRVILE